MSPSSAADGHGPPGLTAAVNGPGLATVTVNGAQTLAVWADGFVMPLAQAARRCGVAAAPPASVREALSDWDRWCAVLWDMASDSAAGDGAVGDGWLAEADVAFSPAITDPSGIYCAAANYYDHTEEMRGKDRGAAGRSPMYFLAPPAALSGHRHDVARPAGCARFDWEVELAVVIGRDARDVAAADAGAVIAGYAVANDLSMRDFARRDDYPFFPDWLRSKCSAGCLPVGPAIVPASFVPDPMKLDLSLTVNGEQRQASSTKNMIFSIAAQIEYLSQIVPLRAGDVILTGTPAGTAAAWGSYLSPGDVMVAEIRGLGRLETRVTDTAASAEEGRRR